MPSMKHLTVLVIFLAFPAIGQLDYFLSQKELNPKLPSPDAFFHYPFGTWHSRYDKMVEYLRVLEKISDRVQVQTMGYTNENREQVLVAFGKPENLAKLEEIRTKHLQLTDPDAGVQITPDMPVIVWLGHNVHGNEPSGGESAILTAYYLAAGQSEEVKKWLENAIVLMEPVINPDGRDRHTHWANMHRGTPPVADPADREHNEAWPGGRTNHYWFDLNRDWFLATQVESQNRLKMYHQWLPNVVTDFHEMGTYSTYFFEPTKENAENPLVPKAVYRDLNGFFAKYYEKAMNGIGSLYYTKESYDNLYPGYGSSYPDLQGGLGLLFEQASSRGHVQSSQHGDLEFRFTIRNQFVNELATIQAAVDGKEMLLKHQQDFFKSVKRQGDKKVYVVGNTADASRLRAFKAMLLHHQIEFYDLASRQTINGKSFVPGESMVIPQGQAQYLMLRSIFDAPKTFADSLFYDASAWNLAMAYNLDFTETTAAVAKGKRITPADLDFKASALEKAEYAYLVDYRDYFGTKALYHLLSKEIFVKVAGSAFTTASGNWSHGTLIIPVSLQKLSGDALLAQLQEIHSLTGVPIRSENTGFSLSGVDMGSRTIQKVEMPKALMLVGDGVSGYEAGEVWHLLDTRVGMPITKVEVKDLNRLDLKPYTSIVLVNGNYPKDIVSKVDRFVKEGGTLITLKGASEWAIQNELVKEKLRELPKDTSMYPARVPYEIVENIEGAKRTGGAIFEAKVDLTHPIGYGYTASVIPVYRNNNTLMEITAGPANSPVIHTDTPWLCGYVHPETLKQISGSSVVNVSKTGRGRVITFSVNPNFRATWYGTNKLFLNALFFGSLL